MSIDWAMALEFTKIILSWPPLAAGFGLIIYLTYKRDISQLISRVKSGRILGADFTVSQSQRIEREAALESNDDAESQLPKLESKNPANAEVEQLLVAERGAARLWEYRFLNYYLAPQTQLSLDWLLSANLMSVHAFDAHLSSLIGNAQERRAVLLALESHNLVDLGGGNVKVTEKGREYSGWIGRARSPALLSAPTSHSHI